VDFSISADWIIIIAILAREVSDSIGNYWFKLRIKVYFIFFQWKTSIFLLSGLGTTLRDTCGQNKKLEKTFFKECLNKSCIKFILNDELLHFSKFLLSLKFSLQKQQANFALAPDCHDRLFGAQNDQ
jgi:hypothetical protein